MAPHLGCQFHSFPRLVPHKTWRRILNSPQPTYTCELECVEKTLTPHWKRRRPGAHGSTSPRDVPGQCSWKPASWGPIGRSSAYCPHCDPLMQAAKTEQHKTSLTLLAISNTGLETGLVIGTKPIHKTTILDITDLSSTFNKVYIADQFTRFKDFWTTLLIS